MFIWNIVKFFIKLGIGLVIGIAILILIVHSGIGSVKDYRDDNYLSMTNVEMSYINISEAPVGSTCKCPLPYCDNYYTKTAGMNTVCCSEKCEREYHELMAHWKNGEREKDFIESRGIKFK